jgi:hypothetical protein
MTTSDNKSHDRKIKKKEKKSLARSGFEPGHSKR